MIGLSTASIDPNFQVDHGRARGPLATIAVVATVLLVFYALPTLLEFTFASAISPRGLIAVGDALGCATLAVFNWRRGIALYAVLSVLEYASWNFGIVTPFELTLFTDAVPAAFLTAGAVRFLGCVQDLQ